MTKERKQRVGLGRRRIAAVAVFAVWAGAGQVCAETAIIAVATNFKPVAETLRPVFEAQSTHQITIAAGSTGKLAAQIASGAPFDLFLAADDTTPARLITEGNAIAGSARSYATGALVLWARGKPIDDPVEALSNARHIAIANPALAPYGRAAQEALVSLGLAETVKPKIVTGENIGQAYALVASGAAEIGFVAASALIPPAQDSQAAAPAIAGWRVPDTLHESIRQDLVLLKHGAQNQAAQDFAAWLGTDAAREIIAAAGYALPPVETETQPAPQAAPAHQ